jgi:protein-disulfide isomerase
MATTQLVPDVNEHDHVQGSPDAPVTLVEYGDFECPYCGQAHNTVKRLQQKFGNQLRFVFRNYPLVHSHPHAEHAAETAEIAASKGKFWEMYDLLFAHQNQLSDKNLVQYAEQLNIDRQTFVQAMEEGVATKRIEEDAESGDQSGVEATPTFFINGQYYDGESDAASIGDAITSALKKEA